jgi:hypothetical protein
MKDEDDILGAIDSESKCPRCTFPFGHACYMVTYEDGREVAVCDCCVAPLIAGGTFEDGHGRRGRVEYTELDFESADPEATSL